MPEVGDAEIESSEFSSHTPADSPQSDTKIQTFSGDLDTDESAVSIDPCHIQQTRKIIRYTKEELLALRESPLVKMPDALLPIISWFGEPVTKKENRKNNTDGSQENEKSKQNSHNLGEGLNKSKDESNTLGIPESPSLLEISKSPNGSEPASPRPSDKIVLGPPKMNFASSSVGGLKNTEDKIAQARTSRSEGLRQRQEDGSFPRTGVKDFEPRAPRGPTGGRGFVGREALRDRTLTEKTFKDPTGSLHNTHGRGIGHSRSQETTRNRRDGGISGKDHLGRSNYSRHQHSEEKSETPEWMNYNPQTDEDSRHGENGEFDDKKHFDIQAWKSLMKEQDKERKDKEKMRSDKERKENIEKGRARSVSRADSSISWRPENKVSTIEDSLQNGSKEKSSSDFDEASRNLSNVDQLFGPGVIDLNPSAFDKFLSQHNLAMAEDNGSKVGLKNAEAIPREQGTSRFARFFTNNDNDKGSQENDHNGRHSGFPVQTQGQIQNTSNELKSVPISIDTLFQSQTAAPPHSPLITSNNGTRLLSGMLTEDEVLQTLGAKPTHKHEVKERNYEDEAAMNKIYAALKKGPSAEVLRQAPPNVPSSSNQTQTQQHSTIVQPGLPFNDPSIISTQKSNPMVKSGQHPPKVDASNKNLGFSELPVSESAKKINMLLFGGNVPTSVYRQLSSRSDNGSRESSAASSPALKFNAKPNVSNFPHSPQSSAHVHDIHAPIFKSPPPRSPVLPHQQSHNHSPYHNVAPPYSNGPSILQHSNNRQEYPPPVGRIPVEQLLGMPPRNVSQQIHPQFQQPPIPVSMPPLPYGLQHQPQPQPQPQPERYPQQLQFAGAPIPQHLSVHHHPGMLPPGTEALFANMHGYAQFIPNLVNNAMAPNNISGIPNNSNLQQRGMMTLEEIERLSLGGR